MSYENQGDKGRFHVWFPLEQFVDCQYFSGYGGCTVREDFLAVFQEIGFWHGKSMGVVPQTLSEYYSWPGYERHRSDGEKGSMEI